MASIECHCLEPGNPLLTQVGWTEIQMKEFVLYKHMTSSKVIQKLDTL